MLSHAPALCRFGRRFVVLLSIFVLLVFGVGNAFSPNLYVYMVLKFSSGISASGIIANAFVIGMYVCVYLYVCLKLPALIHS